ncbi:ribbon-helix-helix protein, CopG family [Clostridium baratii]|uniref:ribbon-helix-helix protein, CopG family n=1 Tax=Clostridium baratii TaxID=1561 RepID=UPI001C01D1D9|nr:ribbon-helix-helix protein, CopG family [Clostridium baratii]MBT9833016.1 ribbon-helix-helix protein, CopG family [Clostridium baratii]
MDKNKRIRVNINISPSTKEYFEQKSKDTGISQSALMAMALNDYIEQKEALGTMQQMMIKLDEIQRMGLLKPRE